MRMADKSIPGNNEFGETRKLVSSELSGYTNGHSQGDDLGRVLGLLFAPTLSLIKHYLQSKNGNKKTIANLLQEFSDMHSEAFLTSFIIDWIFRFVGIVLVVIVFGRGIGLFNF